MPRRFALSGAIGVVMLASACAGGPPADPGSTVASPTGAEEPSASVEPSPPACPNPHGGVCLGKLAAGTYTTQSFGTTLTYRVTDGWSNDEDLPGNFIVFPPIATAADIDAGTADYVAVYDGVAAASADCEERRQADVELTPAAIVAWFVAQPGLAASEPLDVTVGGLDGVVVDLAIAEGYTDGCPYEGYEGVPMVPAIIGHTLASVHHVVLEGDAMRLYLLEGPTGRVLAIEISDVPGGIELEDLDAIVDGFVFSTEG